MLDTCKLKSVEFCLASEHLWSEKHTGACTRSPVHDLSRQESSAASARP